MENKAMNEQFTKKLLSFCKENGVQEIICVISTEWEQAAVLHIATDEKPSKLFTLVGDFSNELLKKVSAMKPKHPLI